MYIKAQKLNFKKATNKSFIFTLFMVALPMIQFIIFWGYVSFDSILMAFKDGTRSAETGELLWNLGNLKQFIEDYNKGIIATCLKNSLINLAVSEFISLPIVVILSYFLYKKCYGAGLFRVLFFLPSLISAVVMTSLFASLVTPLGRDSGPIITLMQKLGITIRKDVLKYGLLDMQDGTAFATVEAYCIWTGVGTNLVLLCGGLARAPQDLFEAAKIDGAGMFKEFTAIVIPILWPTITTLFIFNLAGCFTMYLPVKLLTEFNNTTHTIGYFIVAQTNARGNSVDALGYPAMVGLIFTFITVPVILFVKWAFNKISEAMEF